jgi:hypothetical protein
MKSKKFSLITDIRLCSISGSIEWIDYSRKETAPYTIKIGFFLFKKGNCSIHY